MTMPGQRPAVFPKMPCVVCLYDDTVLAGSVRETCLIYDGNGYCAEHMNDAVRLSARFPAVASRFVPLILAGKAATAYDSLSGGTFARVEGDL